MKTRQRGSFRPILGILTAVLAVGAYQSGALPALPENGGPLDQPALIETLFRLSGVQAPPRSDTAVWPLSGLLAIQSPALRQAAAVAAQEARAEDGASDEMPPTAGPGGAVPLPASSGEPSAAPDSEAEPDPGPVIFGPWLPRAAPAPDEVDPYIEWIGGVYSPPPSDDPEAKRLIEVTLLPSSASGYDNNGTVFFRNRVTDPLDVAGILARPNVLKPSDGAEPQILIIHTHGSESFFPDERDYYVPTDIQRTEDTRFNVVRVGERIAEGLRAQGLNVLHDRTICDYPTYRNAYTKSLELIQQHVREHPSIQMVIDVHRDSLVSENGTAYKAVSVTDSGKAAQMMFVMGSSLNGLPHPTWLDNLSLASHIQQAVLEEYPTLMRPITLRKERYNQHATPGSCLLEVGTAWNTLQEALLAADLFCETAGPVIAERLLAQG